MNLHVPRGVRACLLFALASTVQATQLPAQTAELYQFDPAHATLEFGIRLVGFNRVRGSFDNYDGSILLVQDDPLKSSISLIIDVKSIHTGVQERDDHLKTETFFDAARWPNITFTSQRIERFGGGYAAVGPLTIRDSTHQVRVPFTIVSPKAIDPFGNQRFAVAGRIAINRRDFGVVGPAFWNQAIGDTAELEFEIPGRRWDYTQRSWPSTRVSGGKAYFDAVMTGKADHAEADGWQFYFQHRSDSSYAVSPVEYEKAGGRLLQAGKVREAIGALSLGVRIADASNQPQWSAYLHTQLAETFLRLGDRTHAIENTAEALRMNRNDPAAILLAQYLGVRPKGGDAP